MTKGFACGSLPVLFLVLVFSGCAGVTPRPSVSPGIVAQTGVYHTLEKGQTLWGVARLYRVDIHALMNANGISDPRMIESGRRLLIPRIAVPPAVVHPAISTERIERLVGYPRGSVTWRTITIHHSATRSGNSKVFDRYHKKRGMGGLFYHFLIGNGHGLGNGQIEVGWRWQQQSEVNRPQDIQVCLVGNFMKQQITEQQYQSLKGLIAVLRRRYGISGEGTIRKHCDVAAAGKPTECPGEHFPFARLLQDIRN
jgi:hypothetical protein